MNLGPSASCLRALETSRSSKLNCRICRFLPAIVHQLPSTTTRNPGTCSICELVDLDSHDKLSATHLQKPLTTCPNQLQRSYTPPKFPLIRHKAPFKRPSSTNKGGDTPPLPAPPAGTSLGTTRHTTLLTPQLCLVDTWHHSGDLHTRVLRLTHVCSPRDAIIRSSTNVAFAERFPMRAVPQPLPQSNLIAVCSSNLPLRERDFDTLEVTVATAQVLKSQLFRSNLNEFLGLHCRGIRGGWGSPKGWVGEPEGVGGGARRGGWGRGASNATSTAREPEGVGGGARQGWVEASRKGQRSLEPEAPAGGGCPKARGWGSPQQRLLRPQSARGGWESPESGWVGEPGRGGWGSLRNRVSWGSRRKGWVPPGAARRGGWGSPKPPAQLLGPDSNSSAGPRRGVGSWGHEQWGLLGWGSERNFALLFSSVAPATSKIRLFSSGTAAWSSRYRGILVVF